MKIILSRKGFDSTFGGVASPILHDGRLLSLPIPSPQSPIPYNALYLGEQSVGSLLEDVTHRRISRHSGAHLDPDLNASMYPRPPGWRPLFGQTGAAQSHLSRMGIAEGDLFLFFGWFRQTELVNGRYRYVNGAPNLHLIFGWLQIDAILSLQQYRREIPEWAQYHPHLHGTFGDNNTLYVARRSLQFDGVQQDIVGGGNFGQYRKELCLTAPGCTRTVWELPRWFAPLNGRAPLTYHQDLRRWNVDDEYAYVHSATRGQEFVLDAEQYSEAIEWAFRLIDRAA